VAGDQYHITVTPQLQAGTTGWESFITYINQGPHGSGGIGGGGGGGYPTRTMAFFGGSGLNSNAGAGAPAGDTVDYVLTGPQVAALRVGRATISTIHNRQLPAGDRVAVFFLPAAQPVITAPETQSPPTRPGLGGKPGAGKAPLVIFPLDRRGHRLPARTPYSPLSPSRFWQAPSAILPNIHEPPYHGPAHPLPGACELAQHGLQALTPEWGHAIAHVTPVRDALGEVFISCIDTEYYLHGFPFQVALLLDARSPGQTLGTLPAAVTLPGHRAIVNVSAGNPPGDMSARRIRNAWLIVRGGGPAELPNRLRILTALRIRRLDLHT
jgi:hypothetical protein